jgi:hypothetical protein
MVCDVIMETNVCSLLQLNNSVDTILLNNVRKIDNLLLFRTSCRILYTLIRDNNNIIHHNLVD